MTDDKKPICLHFHIFKNAGTTIDWILEKNFGKQFATLDQKKPGEILSWEEVLTHIDGQKDVKAFSSHQIRFPLPQSDDYNFLQMIFIREPIDRAFSIYNFNKRRKDGDAIGVIKAKELSLADYIRWNLENKKHMTMKNFQVLYLSHRDNTSEVNQNDFDTALSNFKKSPVIGLVDRLDESLVVSEEELRKNFDDIDLSYVKQNVSPDREADLSKRLEKKAAEIGDKLMNELTAHNSFDSKLYSSAKDELELRINKINDFETKLADFKNRCSKL